MIDIIISHHCLIELIMVIYFLHSLVLIDCGAGFILNSRCITLCLLLPLLCWEVAMAECLIYSSVYPVQYSAWQNVRSSGMFESYLPF